VALLLAWVTFPAGGVYPWVWIPAGCAVLLLALRVRPQIASDQGVRAVDVMLMLTGLALVVQLIPLPYSILQTITPNAVSLRAALWLLPPAPDLGALRLPISIVPGDTRAALGIVATAALLFWTCREICEIGGTGRIVRAVAFIGMAASIAAIIQRSQNQELLYGYWRPLDAGARPYGPFVNRNHFATWAVMACPLVFGYLLARVPRPRNPQMISQRLVTALKQFGSIRVWLATSVCLMTLAVLISTSRSGLIGLMGAFGASAWLSRHRHGPSVRRWTIFQGVLLALVVLSFANFDTLMGRLDETLASASSGRGRSAIWADAQRVIRDFRWTGTGAGTFATAVILYQTAEPGYSIGQAHNHYLQLAAEGGAIVGVPAALAIGMFVVLFRRRLEEDTTSAFLIRAGAIAGLTGALLQSFWETGLRMPANAMLFAVLAAIATHTPALPTASSHRTL
jgi:O-antigen ligase